MQAFLISFATLNICKFTKFAHSSNHKFYSGYLVNTVSLMLSHGSTADFAREKVCFKTFLNYISIMMLSCRILIKT